MVSETLLSPLALSSVIVRTRGRPPLSWVANEILNTKYQALRCIYGTCWYRVCAATLLNLKLDVFLFCSIFFSTILFIAKIWRVYWAAGFITITKQCSPNFLKWISPQQIPAKYWTSSVDIGFVSPYEDSPPFSPASPLALENSSSHSSSSASSSIFFSRIRISLELLFRLWTIPK